MSQLESNARLTDAAAFRSIFLKSPNAYVLLDTQLVVVDCNLAYEQRSGISRNQMVGKAFFSVFPAPPNAQYTLRDSMQRVIDAGDSHTIPLLHYPIAARSSENASEALDALQDRYWTVVNIPLFDDNGAVQYLLNHPTDITDLTLLQQLALERVTDAGGLKSHESLTMSDLQNVSKGHNESLMKMQNLLQAERQRMQSLFQQAPGFICVLRGPNHIYEIANDAYYQLIGHREIIGHELAKVLPEVIEQGFLDKLDKVFSTGEVFIGRALPIGNPPAKGV